MLCIPLAPYDMDVLVKVDTKDFWTLADYEWHFVSGYAARNSEGRLIYMHQQIMGTVGTAMHVDHKNGDRFDNRRSNLRVCTASQNRQNAMKPKSANGGPTSSIYKGVSRHYNSRARKQWKMKFGRGRVEFYATEIEAAEAYDVAAREVFGEFARLNFPKDGEQGCREQEVA